MWRESIKRAQSEVELVVTVVPVSSTDKGKAHVDEGSAIQQNLKATVLTDAEVAKLVRERDEAIQTATVHAAKRRKAHILVIRQKEQMEWLCF